MTCVNKTTTTTTNCCSEVFKPQTTTTKKCSSGTFINFDTSKGTTTKKVCVKMPSVFSDFFSGSAQIPVQKKTCSKQVQPKTCQKQTSTCQKQTKTTTTCKDIPVQPQTCKKQTKITTTCKDIPVQPQTCQKQTGGCQKQPTVTKDCKGNTYYHYEGDVSIQKSHSVKIYKVGGNDTTCAQSASLATQFANWFNSAPEPTPHALSDCNCGCKSWSC